ncbi:enoyl-CoA hydratase-related protein [Lipingzhangella sp. LS1_29]|uniref:Enoyl-CoA hydratase-related protein n=1 Tax=Lipingzhangella rawalii TaxID=2055835 RepID=A0ABU2H6B7_9ACTN|nr:enoyl-CoA hydratase-related protein [Lipingzhangella rawalii]MDS1270847.1 enoyl-CoA hydratase-related protein [Lipingzhangella rawalii]
MANSTVGTNGIDITTQASDQVVRIDTDRGIRTITLDSPANRNALSARLRTQLHDALTDAAADTEVRAIVLTGTGPAFCAGADLKEVAAERAGNPPDPNAPTMPTLFAAVMDAPKPVVAKLNGPARAGGIGLVAAADIAIAPHSASFAFTEVRIGVAPAIISVPVAARMADRQLSRYFLTGETFDADHAQRAGLLTEAVADSELDEATERVLAGLRQAAPTALRHTKAILGRTSLPAARRDEELAEMERLSRELFAGDDAAEGRAAFLERRVPGWVL